MTLGEDKLRLWYRSPRDFVEQAFGVTPDPWQLEALEAVRTKQRVAMKSAKGTGKTAFLAWLIWWFMTTRESAKCATTSITKDNIKDNLWPELSLWQNKCEFLKKAFEWAQTRITCRESPENWFCSLRTWPKSADRGEQADTLAGLHAKNLLFVLDEVGGIPDAVMASAEAGLSTVGGDKKLVIAGNPTHLEGPLYRACTTEADIWHLIEITGDPDDPKRSTRVSEKWAREQIKKYGKDNPWVLVNVFGKFPPSSINSLIGPDEVRRAMGRHLKTTDYEFSQKRLGIDVARFGDDSSMIAPRQGLAAFQMHEMKNANSFEIAARVAYAKMRWGSELEFLDCTGGWGAGVEDAMEQSHTPVLPIAFNGKAFDPRYFNKRTEMWFEMCLWIKGGGALPPDDVLLKELTSPTYSFQDGKFRLEEKEQIKARLMFSPNRADALCLTFALPDMPTEAGIPAEMQALLNAHRGQLETDYDPHQEGA